ncbi:response regulator [Methylobacterium sp. WL30]|uniref:response regulator n=1 Tax=unclassified Methylobacterium TaxID=2615210 RepID=UPI0011C8A66B|nr:MULTISPECIES: response regulator [unclassified Methylobacterium]MCJ2075538.1 response regulator [Methylobacterium sp. E-016]TXN41235.1 response regulator [Methylobacterium sp. WL93]TXN50651.1 response regulator [Methylobacterium sp. WL119]TXN68263.1 response regulator [Methylobacterium sp. WL30]TXN73050.1 response regulator [Methylobacterium sp. WL6]
MNRSILVVDDDPHIREVICFALGKAGHVTQAADGGEAALAEFDRQPPRLIVLDVGLPGIDGLEVCRRVRRSSDVPILFLSARDEEIDRVLGLEIGGDDYVTKPFSPRELVARVGIILRRVEGQRSVMEGDGVLRRGSLVLDPPRHAAAYGSVALALTAVEFAMLRALAVRPGHVLSRDQLMDAAYSGRVHVSDRTIDSHVRNLRAKLAAVGCSDAIETIHGVGFRLGPCGARA